MAGGFTFEDLVMSCLYVMLVMTAGKLFGLTGGTPLVVCKHGHGTFAFSLMLWSVRDGVP